MSSTCCDIRPIVNEVWGTQAAIDQLAMLSRYVRFSVDVKIHVLGT